LVLVRHGESTWNKENRFTGWVDVPLAESGVLEAERAGKALKAEDFEFDIMYTSRLQRAIRTGITVLGELGQLWIPIVQTWRLNERHYGALQGLNKKETVEKHGDEQVNIWRRSYDVPPPAMDVDNEYYAGKEGRKYADLAKDKAIPVTECLKDCVERFLPWYLETCVPAMKSGKKVLIAAHGNSLRALVKYLDDISDDVITGVNIPTAIPLVYKIDPKTMKPVEASYAPLSGRYVGDQEMVRNAIEGVAAQTGKK
ncbi:phosphoglycerate mutase 1, partial [Baffinella frigidus]